MIESHFYKLVVLSLILAVLSVLPLGSLAQSEIIVTPVIIEAKAEARDILEYSAKLAYSTGSTAKADIYAIVNDISMTEGGQEFIDPYLLDKNTSLARWVQIDRGVIELWPGEEKEIPFSIQIFQNAKPGKYYATIAFARGATRPDAEEQSLKLNQPHILLNIEVEEHIVEKAQIKKFQTEKNFFFGSPIKFLLEIENIGNREIKPEGLIYIYNRKGQDIGSIDVNQAQAGILPAASNLFESIWQAKMGFGQYKAQLSAEYGSQEKRDLQDTVYFWVFPRQILIFSGGFIFLIFILLLVVAKKPRHPSSGTYYPDKVIDLRPSK